MINRALVMLGVGVVVLLASCRDCRENTTTTVDVNCVADGGAVARAYEPRSSFSNQTCTVQWDGGRDIAFDYVSTFCSTASPVMIEFPQDIGVCDFSMLPDGAYTLHAGAKPFIVSRPDGGAATCTN